MNAPDTLLPLLPTSRVLTRDGVFTDDPWPLRATDARSDGSDSIDRIDDSEPALLPLAAYLAQPQPAVHGLWLAPDDDPALLATQLAGHLASVPLIAIQFPRVADGRGYSLAHLVRRLGYAGDLRAIGEVLVDQLFMMKRVGFSSFALRADQHDDDALAALRRYDDAYQAAFDQPLPAYRRGRRVQGASR